LHGLQAATTIGFDASVAMAGTAAAAATVTTVIAMMVSLSM
jgi:hypothetical protein